MIEQLIRNANDGIIIILARIVGRSLRATAARINKQTINKFFPFIEFISKPLLSYFFCSAIFNVFMFRCSFFLSTSRVRNKARNCA